MFFGGIAVAIGFEKCNLHRRTAVAILRIIGTEPKWLLHNLVFFLAISMNDIHFYETSHLYIDSRME